jgi:3-methyladenine DNA glycosylase Tag
VENARIPYSFVRRLVQELAQLRHRRKIDSFQSLLDNVTITIEKIEEEKGPFAYVCALVPPTTISPLNVRTYAHLGAILLGPDGQVLQMPSEETTRKRFLRQDVPSLP